MKQLFTLTSSLVLSALLLTAHAQAPAASPSQAKPAPKMAGKHAVAHVAKDSKIPAELPQPPKPLVEAPPRVMPSCYGVATGKSPDKIETMEFVVPVAPTDTLSTSTH